MKLLVLAEIALIGLFAAIVGAAQLRDNLAPPQLAGSIPPDDQRIARLDDIRGISPPLPAFDRPTLLVATCLDCPSGAVVEGVLRRLDARELPGDARLVVVGWGGDGRAWAERAGIPRVHVADGSAAPEVRRRLHVGASGVAFLVDGEGIWRATYQLGQMREADIVHDLGVI